MEDYTYHLDARRRADPRRAHARGLPVDRRRRRPRLRDPPAGHRRPRGPGPPGLRRRARRRRRARPVRPGRPVPAGRQRGRASCRRRSRCRSCRSPAPSGSRSPTSRPRPSAGSTAGGPHHTVLSTAARPPSTCDRPRRDGSASSWRSSTRTPQTSGSFRQELRWNQRLPPAGPGLLSPTSRQRATEYDRSRGAVPAGHDPSRHRERRRMRKESSHMRKISCGGSPSAALALQPWPRAATSTAAPRRPRSALRQRRRRREGHDRRRHADQDLRAVDRGRRQHQEARSRRPATQVNLQYANDDIPTQVTQVDEHGHQEAPAAGHRRHRRHRPRATR